MTQSVSPKFSVRPARPEDRLAVTGLMSELQEYERGMESNRMPGAEIAGRHLAYLEHVVARHDGAIFVAVAGGNAVGFVVCFVEECEPGDMHVVPEQRRYGCISDLFVAAAYRARGVGGRLVSAAEAHLCGLGLTRVQISFLARNEQAGAAYRRLGYSPYMVTYAKRMMTYSKRLGG